MVAHMHCDVGNRPSCRGQSTHLIGRERVLPQRRIELIEPPVRRTHIAFESTGDGPCAVGFPEGSVEARNGLRPQRMECGGRGEVIEQYTSLYVSTPANPRACTRAALACLSRQLLPLRSGFPPRDCGHNTKH